MTERPRALLNTKKCSALKLGRITNTPVDAVWKQLCHMFDSGETLCVSLKTRTAPWAEENILTFLDRAEREQLMLWVDKLTAQETAIALMGLERGYSVFLALNNHSGNSHSMMNRLARAGVTILTKDEIFEEAAL